MSGYLKILVILSFLFIMLGNAQEIVGENTGVIDSSSSGNFIPAENLLINQTGYDLYLLGHNLSLREMYDLYFLYNNEPANTRLFNASGLNKLLIPYCTDCNYESKDSLTVFNN